ncbi:DUF3192 domain-containing protein [Pseudoalteromonas denitrificans]|uniref:DUF3192 domain-containing protein n=1 Tax=Pseudoalteromonas denitrificans DSM 6059 TaxID=1123010 RepID=A0A1I1T2C5_9GAMM|nr:DUF3192 domain-containing protein [Pseudoalteromonas denitrificans]SFD52817.1 Protein of unknown function [Pseudoalteromonas denitrificans DSM 6059]
MKKIAKTSLILLTASALNACVFVGGYHSDNDDWEEKQQLNREVISNLILDTQRTTIEMKLGTPNFTEAFIKAQDEYRVMYYRTSRQHHDSVTSKDETTPLIFKNNKLIAWGHDALSKIY